jgi:hypothetical protein
MLLSNCQARHMSYGCHSSAAYMLAVATLVTVFGFSAVQCSVLVNHYRKGRQLIRCTIRAAGCANQVGRAAAAAPSGATPADWRQ